MSQTVVNNVVMDSPVVYLFVMVEQGAGCEERMFMKEVNTHFLPPEGTLTVVFPHNDGHVEGILGGGMSSTVRSVAWNSDGVWEVSLESFPFDEEGSPEVIERLLGHGWEDYEDVMDREQAELDRKAKL